MTNSICVLSSHIPGRGPYHALIETNSMERNVKQISMPAHKKCRFTQAGSVLVFPTFQHLALHSSYSFNINFVELFFSKHFLYYINTNLVLYIIKTYTYKQQSWWSIYAYMQTKILLFFS